MTTAVHEAVAGMGHDDASPSVRDALVEIDRIKALKVALNSSFIANMAVGVMLAAVLVSMFPMLPVFVWLGGLLLLQRYRRLLRFFRSWLQSGKPAAAASKALSARRFEIDSLLLAAYWGCTGLWFFDGSRQGVQFAVAHALGGVSLVSLGVHAYHPRVMRWFLVIVNLPFIVHCIAQLDLHHEYVGSGMLLMNIYLMVFGRHLSKVVRQAIELRHENTDLVAELKNQTLQLRAANEAKSRFLAAASHDLRQPVHAVGLLAAAMKTHDIDACQKDLLHKLQSGLRLFSDVVDEILDVARLEAGVVPVNMQRVPLAPLLGRVDATFYELAAGKGLSLVTRMAGDVHACAWADPALLWRILSNLVSNAIRYTDRGTVLVAIRLSPAVGNEQVNAQTGCSAGAWRIEVRDSGPGISPEHQAKVFDEFYQVANLQRDSQQGLGLGLAVARRMASLMGARLALRSRLGVGSVFAVTVDRIAEPADSGRPLLVQRAMDATPVVLAGLKVLVIDDDDNSRNAMHSLLMGWQIETRVVPGPVPACALIMGGFIPNVLITDHWLDDSHNSLTAVQQVRNALNVCRQPMPVVAVFTGDISLATRQHVQSLGWYFATKPVRPEGLMEWLCGQALTSNHIHKNAQR